MYRIAYVSKLSNQWPGRAHGRHPRQPATSPRILRTRSHAARPVSSQKVGVPATTVSPASTPATTPQPPLNLVLRLQCRDGAQSTYLVRFFDAETGLLTSHFIRNSFEACLQLVRFRLPISDDYYIAGTWKGQIGQLAVSTPNGPVLARIGPVDDQLAAMDRPDVLPMPAVSA